MRDRLPMVRPPSRRLVPSHRLWTRWRGVLAPSLVPLLFALLAAACARRIPVGEGGAAAAAAADAAADSASAVPLPDFVYVSVENRNTSDVIVWVEGADGRVTRIGTATASRGTTLQFPGSFIAASARLHLRARLVGGRGTLRSEGFTVQPGQQVVWTLENALRRSMVSVY